MSDIRIGYLVSQYPATSHTFIQREIEALRRAGIEIVTFSIRRPRPEEARAGAASREYEETSYVLPAKAGDLIRAHAGALVRRPGAYFRSLRLAWSHRVPGLRAAAWAFFHFAESILVARMIERSGVGHLHNHFANSGATVGMLAARFLDLPWSLTLHGISETDYPAGLLLGEKVAAARFVACVSWFGRAQAMRVSAPEDWPKLIIARCGLDLAALPRRPQPEPRGDHELHILCVGRLSAEKGHIGLIEAFALLRARRITARLSLVGDGPERARIEQAIKSLGVGDAVRMAGRLGEDETLREIARSDVLVLPSLMEGLPIVLMEAMAMGVPVIAARIAGIPELIEDGKEGLLFTPGDWRDLEAKVELLLTSPDLRLRLSDAAAEKIRREFEIGNAIEPLAARFTARLNGA